MKRNLFIHKRKEVQIQARVELAELEVDGLFCPACKLQTLLYVMGIDVVKAVKLLNPEQMQYINDERTHICLACGWRGIITEM